MQTEYAIPGGTLRENLLRQPGQAHLRKDHYGDTFAWDTCHDKDGKEIVSKSEGKGNKRKQVDEEGEEEMRRVK